jgi:hypothetical protein
MRKRRSIQTKRSLKKSVSKRPKRSLKKSISKRRKRSLSKLYQKMQPASFEAIQNRVRYSLNLDLKPYIMAIPHPQRQIYADRYMELDMQYMNAKTIRQLNQVEKGIQKLIKIIRFYDPSLGI